MDDTCDQSVYEAILRMRPSSVIGETRACKLCNHPAHSFDTVDFNKSCNNAPLPRSSISVEYFRCQNCELMFTDFFEKWSQHDFADYIYNDSYEIVDPEYRVVRPARTARDMANSLAGAEHRRVLDYGSGAGAFAIEMSRNGFQTIDSYDPFSYPQRPQGLFDIVTCFEAIEHSPDPREVLGSIMSYVAPGGVALVGQTLQPADIGERRGNWWYVAPRNGHINLFSCETLHLYAQANNLKYCDFGNLFALTHADQSALTRTIIERLHPQPRRTVVNAPAGQFGVFEAWHEAEISPSGAFRWTRGTNVSFGTHHTPHGLFRVVMRHLGKRSSAFLAQSRIRVGTQERPISVHDDDLFAVFDLPFAGAREISLHTPEPFSDAAVGAGSDVRPVGLAIACEISPE